MIKEIPIYITILFELTVLGTIAWFYRATRSSAVLIILVVWTILQSLAGISGMYQDTSTIPPRMMVLGVFPTLIVIAIIFLTAWGKKFMNAVSLKTVTYFHSIRIPVEIVLILLFHQGVVSVYMTFEGTNFDLFSGITASLVAYIAFKHGKVNRKLLIGWNILCLLLLLNVVITAILALPSPFQKLSFDQPNMAVLYFPFNLLPTVIVPLVFFAHLLALRQLIKRVPVILSNKNRAKL